MLKYDPQSLMEQIREDEKVRDEVIAASEAMIRAFQGRHFRADQQPDMPMPENDLYEWARHIKPSVIFDNPVCHVEMASSGAPREVADAMREGVNWITRQTGLWKQLSRVFDDACFSFGVMRISYELMPGYDDIGDAPDAAAAPGTKSETIDAGNDLDDGEPGERVDGNHNGLFYRPCAYRVSPRRWFLDARADCYEDARLAGHMWRRDRHDLLADDRYDAEEIMRVVADSGLEKYDPRDKGLKAAGVAQIVGYEIWVRENHSPSEIPGVPGSGTIYTLAYGQTESGDHTQARWIRRPRAWIGPASGPYTLFGYTFVPDCPYPISPFAAMYEQVKEANAHAVGVARDAASFKEFAVVDAVHEEAAATIQEVKHGQLAIIPGAKEGVVQKMSLGGVAPERYQYLQMLESRRQRMLGLSNNARGQIETGVTATAVADAAAQRDVATAMLKRLFVESTQQVVTGLGWYLFTVPNTVFPLSAEVALKFVPRPRDMPPEAAADEIAAAIRDRGRDVDVEEVRRSLRWEPKVLFMGGPADRTVEQVPHVTPDGRETSFWIVSPNSGGASFEHMRFNIEAYSMERTEQHVLQRRVIQTAELAIRIIPMMARYPFVRWRQFWDWVGQPINQRGLADMLFDMGAFEQAVAASPAARSEADAGTAQRALPPPADEDAQPRAGAAGAYRGPYPAVADAALLGGAAA